MCEVGTLLTHNGMDAVSNLCVTQYTSAWQYAVTGDSRRIWKCISTLGPEEALNNLLRSFEATASSVEVPLAGRADDGCWCHSILT